MIKIDDKILSDDIVEKKFVCDLSACKGACCVAGDAGAPLTFTEKTILDEIFPKIKKYMSKKGIEAVEANGTSYLDNDYEYVTQLVNGAECAFAVFENNIALCAVEKAFNDGIISFRKPQSCYLYPIRTKKLDQLTGLNYDMWDICKPARTLGAKTDTPVYKFLEKPLKEAFGKEWFEKLKYFAENNKK